MLKTYHVRFRGMAAYKIIQARTMPRAKQVFAIMEGVSFPNDYITASKVQ